MVITITPLMGIVFGLLGFVLFVILISIRQINEYERGVLFALGKFSRVVRPGWRLVIPIFQFMQKVDLRLRAVDVPHQESLTKDNISVGVNAVLYFKVIDAEKAVINIQNFYYATSQLAQTTMRNAVGEVVLDKLLADREEVSHGIRDVIAKFAHDWGIEVVNIELKDIIIPDDLKRTIGKEAEAERERRAVIIKAQGEVESAKNMAAAAKLLHESPGAMHLRTLQSINDISSDDSNTTVWLLPVEILEAMGRMGKK